MHSRILLIEDNPADVFLIREALRSHKVDSEIEWLADGDRAVERIGHFGGATPPPDLILLDLNLPRMEGKEVLAHIRENSHLDHTRVAILTSSDAEHDRVETASLGANGYIIKPPTLDEYLRVGVAIRELLEARPI